MSPPGRPKGWVRSAQHLRSPASAWPWVAAALLATLLLLAFQGVVRRAVQQGEARRASATLTADAVWRCHGLRSRSLLGACLAEIGPQRDVAAAR
jgi:hypothetical protein